MTAEEIRQMIAAGLPCDHLEVDGDGHHWFAVIVSPDFEGKRSIARHQMVYATLGTQMGEGALHALSMKTLTPQEWGDQQDQG